MNDLHANQIESLLLREKLLLNELRTSLKKTII